MRFVIAQRRLGLPGGSETFVLTIAEHCAKLGHEVIIWALEVGLAAKLARERLIDVVCAERELPDEADATIALDRRMAIDLAHHYPRATRLYAMHNTLEAFHPPPEPGIVAATLAPNDRLELIARGCTGAGEVVRIRQPVDLARFGTRGRARDQPKRVLLLSNYLWLPGHRIEQLQRAWSRPSLEWHRIGHPEPITEVAEEIAKADIVVGYGRSILEAMSCSRPAYIHEHSGSDGWVTTESYAQMEANGFAGTALRPSPDLEQLREDLQHYDPELGQIGNDLVRAHHDAGTVVAGIIALIDRLQPTLHRYDPAALRALRYLAESQLRMELLADEYRYQSKRQAQARQSENDRHHQEWQHQEEEKQRLRQAQKEILASSSWRITSPLRWFGRKFPVAARVARRLINTRPVDG